MNPVECVSWRSADILLTQTSADCSSAAPRETGSCSPNAAYGMQGPKPGHAFSGTPRSRGWGCASPPPARNPTTGLPDESVGRPWRVPSELSLKAARARAAEELAVIRAGEADPLERRREARRAPTVADGLERFFGDYAPARIEIGRMTARTVKDYRQQALQYLVPALGTRKSDPSRRRGHGGAAHQGAAQPRAGARVPTAHPVRDVGVASSEHEPCTRLSSAPARNPGTEPSRRPSLRRSHWR